MAAVALMAAACQEGLDQISTEEGMGNVTLNISTKEHTRTGDDFSPEELRVRIYDKDDRLVRLYTDINEIPEKIALVAGTYTFKVEGRDTDHTTKFKGSDIADDREKIYYIGENNNVTVVAGQSVDAKINCNPQHVRVGVVLDKNEGENKLLSKVNISLAVMDINGKGTAVDNLKKADFDKAYTAASGADKLDFEVDSVALGDLSDYAYFLLPEDEDGDPTVETIAWAITGKHTVKAEAEGDPDVVTAFDRAGQIVVQKGTAYELQFRYSQLPDGSITVTVTVDDTVEGKDDKYTFKPEPEITPLEGNSWTEDAANNVYVVGTSDISFKVTSINKINGFGFKIDDEAKVVWKDGKLTDEYNDKGWMEVTPNDTEGKDFTVKVNPAFFATLPGGMQNFHFAVYDGATEVGKFKTTFKNQGLTAPTEVDLWANTAKFNAVVTDESATGVVVKFRKVESSDWVEVPLSGSNYDYSGTSVAVWTEGENVNKKTVYTPNSDKSIFANNTYEYQLYIDGEAYGPSAKLTTSVEQPIPNADFESSSLSCFGTSNSNAPFWGSGNNNFKQGLCTQETKDGQGGNSVAKLDSSDTLGVLASGNLFTGIFTMTGMSGTVGFGQPYTWTARPTALQVKLHATVGTVDIASYEIEEGKKPLNEGDQDIARIYALIVDWSDRPGVTSGTSEPSGCFEPTAITSLAGSGAIIGYASLLIEESTKGSSMVTVDIPFEFYDTDTMPSSKYSIVISAACSAYGDYMCGCSKNELYVDDFQWVY